MPGSSRRARREGPVSPGRRLGTPSSRLLLAGLVDWTGTGFYLAVSAIFLTRSVGLTVSEVGLALACAGAVAFALSVPTARLGDRFGHRRVLIGLHLVRAAAFLALAWVAAMPVVLGALAVIAVADQAAASVNQALAGELLAPELRVAFMARLRTVTNIGITLGTLPAGLALAAHVESFAALLVANALTYLLAASLVCSVAAPEATEVRTASRRFLRPSRPTTALITVDGVLSMWNVILNVGLPLWVVASTSAPAAVVAVLYATNTVLAVLLQSRLSRGVGTYLGAARAQRLAGGCLALSCSCLAASAMGDGAAATAALTLAVVLLTLGELLKASATWTITFSLAPEGRTAEFIATYGLGRAACQVVGPVVLTAAVLVLGATGWVLLAGLFLVAGGVTPALAPRALRRPTSSRRDDHGGPARSLVGVRPGHPIALGAPA